MGKLVVFLMGALVLEAIGVVLLNKGLRQVGEITTVNLSEIARLVRHGCANPNILLGIFFEALFFIGLLILLSKADISLVWPLTSLGFVITTLAAQFFLRETVTSLRWTGVVLIVAGATLVSWSEGHKPKPQADRAGPVQADGRP
jgi:drug/metabolite transporter (DMT)-like permease